VILDLRVAPVRRAAILVVLVAAAACSSGPVTTPPIIPGTVTAAREVNVIAKDWQFLPDRVDLVLGETVLFHILNGGLDVHDVVIGGPEVQGAWERAEAATVGQLPGPTAVVSVPPELAGLRVVVASGQRVDVAWTVPIDAGAPSGGGLVVGCHIPGHWEKGMVVPIRLVQSSPAP
jgi:uncharacterized cupredoxin-like copper-binding protein